MKKVLCLLVALFFVGSIALADVIDLNSLSDDELLALKDQVSQAVSDRGLIKELHFSSGSYIVGTDIKAGYYKITVPPGAGYCMIGFGKSIASLHDQSDAMFLDSPYVGIDDDPMVYKFSFVDGNLIYLKTKVDVIFEPLDMIG